MGVKDKSMDAFVKMRENPGSALPKPTMTKESPGNQPYDVQDRNYNMGLKKSGKKGLAAGERRPAAVKDTNGSIVKKTKAMDAKVRGMAPGAKVVITEGSSLGGRMVKAKK